MGTAETMVNKPLYHMTSAELRAAIAKYDGAGEAGTYWANMCRDQLRLLGCIEESFSEK